MNRDAVTSLIISELGKNRTPSDVSRMLCERGLMEWNEAEALVHQIRRSHSDHIARKQTPMLMILVIMGILVGSGMIIMSVTGFAAIFFGVGDDPAYATMRAARYSTGYGFQRLIILGGLFLTGLGMVAGSIWGSGDVLKTMFKPSSKKRMIHK